MLGLLVLLAAFWTYSLVAANCPKTTAIETLDLKSLEGKWYQLGSFGTMFIHGLDRCQVATITAGTDGKSFVIAHDRIARLLNTHIKYNWTVKANGDKLSGDLTLRFKLPIIGSVAMPLKILGTDYKNYIILQICREFASIFNFNSGFILTRKRHYHAKELESIYALIDDVLKKNKLPRSKFSLSIQTNCEGKSSTPSTSDTSTSGEKSSTAVSQQIETSAPSTGATEEKKTSETPSIPESATTQHNDDKTTTEHPEKTTSVDEKSTTTTVSTTSTDNAAETGKTAASETEKPAAS